MSKPTESAPAEKKSGSKKILIIVGLTVFCVIAGGAGAWYFMRPAPAATAAAAPAPKPPVFLPLEVFTVNLQQEEREHVAQVVMTLQVEDAQSSDMFKAHMPEARNRILMLLSSKKASELYPTDGKEKLAKEIVATVNTPFAGQVQPQKAVNAFFTSFLIQ
jgi:flagellar FliL protein